MSRLALLALLLTGCANTLAWKRIDRPDLYGTAYQKSEHAWAQPCRNWCALVGHIPESEQQSFLVVRGGSDGLTCSCAVPARGALLLNMSERQRAPAFSSWLVTKMPAESVEALSVESVKDDERRGLIVAAEVAAEALR